MNKVTLKSPLAHQVQIGNSKLDNVLDHSKTGTGKSIAFLQFAKTRNYAKLPNFGLIIVVKKALNQFRDEILATQAGVPYIITRKKRPSLTQLRMLQANGVNVYLISNKELLNDEQSVDYIKSCIDIFGGRNQAVLHLDEVHIWRNTQKIWDASGKHKIYKVLTVRNTITVAQLFKFKYFATATPFDKLISEMWLSLHMLYPEEFDNYYNFKDQYTRRDWWSQQDVNRDGALEALYERIAPFTYSFELKDVTDVTYELKMDIIKVAAPKPVIKLANFLTDTLGKEVTFTVPQRKDPFGNIIPEFEVTHWIRHPFALVSAHRKLSSTHGLKKEWIYEKFVGDEEPTVDNPLLVLCKYKNTAREIAQYYGVTPIMAGVELTDERKYAHVIVGTIDSLKQSVSLEHIKRLVVVDPDWSSISLRQMKGRILRVTSTSDVVMYVLLSDIEIDTTIQDIVDSKLAGVDVWEKISQYYNDNDSAKGQERTVAQLQVGVTKVMSNITKGNILVKYAEPEKLAMFKSDLLSMLGTEDYVFTSFGTIIRVTIDDDTNSFVYIKTVDEAKEESTTTLPNIVATLTI